MSVTKLGDGLHMIPGLVNTYLLDTAGGLTLVDTGFARDTAKILRGIAEIGREPEDVRHILLTHAHPDHVGGAAALRERTGAKLYAHAADAGLVETGGPFRPPVSAPGLRNRIVVAMSCPSIGPSPPIDQCSHSSTAQSSATSACRTTLAP